MAGPPSTSLGPFNGSVTVCNQGTVGGSTEVEVHATWEQGGSSSPSLPIATLSIGFLPPGQCQTQPVRGWLRGVAAGVYVLGAVADPGHTTPELQEDNNSKVDGRFGLGVRPDFVVTEVSGPPSTIPGSFIAAVTVCNSGTAPGKTQVDLYASPTPGLLPPMPGLSPLAHARLVGSMPSNSL
ncbi:hypothetical protein [Hyalangium versicolor]|uniref:hypothetical protein n=1 Tax=Hyalangium versicolor TaxID=2861190 RepID=UPI001CCDE51B|nr:hypothetical protein [Hyalangium versicolor]